jgi:hypothetical protein
MKCVDLKIDLPLGWKTYRLEYKKHQAKIELVICHIRGKTIRGIKQKLYKLYIIDYDIHYETFLSLTKAKECFKVWVDKKVDKL